MTHKRHTFPTLSPSSRAHTALRRQVEADLAQIKGCQRGEHAWLATQSPGVVVCTFCRTVGVCLWCGVIPPQGATVRLCATHTPLVTEELAALTRSATPHHGKEGSAHV